MSDARPTADMAQIVSAMSDAHRRLVAALPEGDAPPHYVFVVDRGADASSTGMLVFLDGADSDLAVDVNPHWAPGGDGVDRIVASSLTVHCLSKGSATGQSYVIGSLEAPAPGAVLLERDVAEAALSALLWAQAVPEARMPTARQRWADQRSLAVEALRLVVEAGAGWPAPPLAAVPDLDDAIARAERYGEPIPGAVDASPGRSCADCFHDEADHDDEGRCTFGLDDEHEGCGCQEFRPEEDGD